MINNHIKVVKRLYSVPICVCNFIDEIPESEIQFTVNDQLFLETLLFEKGTKRISFGSYVKRKMLIRKKALFRK